MAFPPEAEDGNVIPTRFTRSARKQEAPRKKAQTKAKEELRETNLHSTWKL